MRRSTTPATSPHRRAASPSIAAPAAVKSEGNSDNKAAVALLAKHSCTACHGVDKKIVGPGFNEVAKKHAGKAEYLSGKIRSGGSGVWGAVAMPAQALPESDARKIAEWISNGAGK